MGDAVMSGAEKIHAKDENSGHSRRQPSFSGLNVGGIKADPFTDIYYKPTEKNNGKGKKFVPYTPYEPSSEKVFSNVQALVMRANQVSKDMKINEPVAEMKEDIVKKNIFIPRPLEQFPPLQQKHSIWKRVPKAARYAAMAMAIVVAHMALIYSLKDQVPKPEQAMLEPANIVIKPKQADKAINEPEIPKAVEMVKPITQAALPERVNGAEEIATPVDKPSKIPVKPEAKVAAKKTEEKAVAKSKNKPQPKVADKSEPENNQPSQKIYRLTYNLNKTAAKKAVLVESAAPVKMPTPAGERELIELLNRR